MPTTSNFGWTTPADTDLVKDGAAAIRTLGNGIDTSLVDLKGGTTGQVLSKNSNTDLDYTWVTPNVGDITEVQAGTGISVASGTGPIPVVTNSMATEITAKGDLIVGTGSGTFDNLPVGTNGHTLVADSATSTGLKWAAPSSPSFVGCSLYLTGNSTWTGATDNFVAFNAEEYDTDGFHSTVTNTSRITIPAGKAGKYLLVGTSFPDSSVTYNRLRFFKNGNAATSYGVATAAQWEISSGTFVNTACVIVNAAVGDYFEFSVIPSTTITNSTNRALFQAAFLGA